MRFSSKNENNQLFDEFLGGKGALAAFSLTTGKRQAGFELIHELKQALKPLPNKKSEILLPINPQEQRQYTRP